MYIKYCKQKHTTLVLRVTILRRSVLYSFASFLLLSFVNVITAHIKLTMVMTYLVEQPRPVCRKEDIKILQFAVDMTMENEGT